MAKVEMPGKTPLFMRPVLGFIPRAVNSLQRADYQHYRASTAQERRARMMLGTPGRRGSFDARRLRDLRTMQDQIGYVLFRKESRIKV